MTSKKSLDECAAILKCTLETVGNVIKSTGIRKKLSASIKLTEEEFEILKKDIEASATTTPPKAIVATVIASKDQQAVKEIIKVLPQARVAVKTESPDRFSTIKKSDAMMTSQKVSRKVEGTHVTEKKTRRIFKKAVEAEVQRHQPLPVPDIEPIPEIKGIKPPIEKPVVKVKSVSKEENPVVTEPVAESNIVKNKQDNNVDVAKPVVSIPQKPKTFNSETLYQLQIERQEQAKQDSAKKLATPPPVVASASQKNGKKKKEDIIRIDPKAVSAHKKKKKRSFTFNQAIEKTSDSQQVFHKPTKPIVREVKIPEFLSVTNLAQELSMKSGAIIHKLMENGIEISSANDLLDRDTAWIIVEELGHIPVEAPPEDEKELDLIKCDTDSIEYESCAPIVTVMGHVDHGKTSLLDYIRKARVVSSEAGGITQHIGAYRVNTSFGPVSFIDTPGHALFTEMRSRGAKITNIVVLVVAADDGVKPQTIEAINHAKAANVPIVVAVNKIDKPDANLENVKSELAQHNVLPEDWGGDAIVIPISAQTGEGIDKLLDALAIQAEILELKAPVNVPAVGTVVESRVDKGRGIIATIIVSRGILKVGDFYLCGADIGRIRAMWDSLNPKIKEAHPSMSVEIQGLSSVPAAGEELMVVKDEKAAKHVASIRQEKMREKRLANTIVKSVSLDAQSLLNVMNKENNQIKTFNVIVKTDVEGSREAVAAALGNIAGKNSKVKVIHSGVGAVTESDIYLAQTGDGIVVAFNVRPDNRVRKAAESRGIKIIIGNVIYELVEKILASVLDTLPPIVEEKITGVANVLQIFNVSKVGQVAGCRVEEGTVCARALVRLVRDNVSVYEGRIDSLRHFKDESSEVKVGSECGISIARFNDIKTGDKIETFERTETASEL